jgi:hypothetical protein
VLCPEPYPSVERILRHPTTKPFTMKVRRSKFDNRIVREDGHLFDSKAEHKRYCELKLLLKARLIEGLEVHPKFNAEINGRKICMIELDFRYFDKSKNKLIYEDVKGFDPPISKLKRKLLLALFPEVELNILTAK